MYPKCKEIQFSETKQGCLLATLTGFYIKLNTLTFLNILQNECCFL